MFINEINKMNYIVICITQGHFGMESVQDPCMMLNNYLFNQVLFFIGITNIPSLEDSLALEQNRYGDLVQEDYIDSYRNLTHKAISALKYISLHCSHVTYVLKTDDDVFVNIFALLQYLVNIDRNSSKESGVISSPRHQEDFISCLIWHKMQVDRNPESKWFVPNGIWNETYFPPYCSGAAFLTSGRTVEKLFQMASKTAFFWIDDVRGWN